MRRRQLDRHRSDAFNIALIEPGRGKGSEEKSSGAPRQKSKAQFRLHGNGGSNASSKDCPNASPFRKKAGKACAQPCAADGAKELLAGFSPGAPFGAKEMTMASTCLGCGARLNNEASACPTCRRAVAAASMLVSRPLRRRPAIPVAAILAIGFLGALAFGSGKVALGPPASADAAVTASVDGKPVAMGGPAIDLLEHQFAGTRLQQGTWTATGGQDHKATKR